MKAGVIKFTVFILLVVGILASAQAAFSQPEPKPERIDQNQAGEPVVNKLPNGHVTKSYKNKAGQVFAVQEYVEGFLAKVTKIREVWPNGQNADVRIYYMGVSGTAAGVVEKDEIIAYDKKGNVINKMTYKDFVNTQPQTRIDEENGKTVTYKYDPDSGTYKLPEDIKPNPNAKVSFADVKTKLDAYIAAIDKRQQEMTETYYYSYGTETLKKAFAAAKIQDPFNYSDSWGKWLGLDYSESAKAFYNESSRALVEESGAFRARGYALQSELDAIDTGMKQWTDTDTKIAKVFQKLLALKVQRGFFLGQKDEYLKVAGGKIGVLAHQTPYPSFQIDALNQEMTQRSKDFDKQEKEAVDQYESVRIDMQKLAALRPFKKA